MPTDSSKQPQQILAIPGTPSGPQLVSLVNDRIDQINLAFQKFLQNPALGAADLGQQKIINLADPKDDLDGVNLRTLKKFGAVPVDTGTGKGSGIEQPTIYFTFDGLPFDGEESPFAIIMANRDGFTPTAVSASAVGAPTSADTQISVEVLGSDFVPVEMLASNLSIPLGTHGPVFTSAFGHGGSLKKGTLLRATIVVAGGATQVTIGLAIRGGG